MPKLKIANSAEPCNPVSRLLSDWVSGDLIETLPAAVYVCNEAVVVAYNRRAAELWGRARPWLATPTRNIVALIS